MRLEASEARDRASPWPLKDLLDDVAARLCHSASVLPPKLLAPGLALGPNQARRVPRCAWPQALQMRSLEIAHCFGASEAIQALRRETSRHGSRSKALENG